MAKGFNKKFDLDLDAGDKLLLETIARESGETIGTIISYALRTGCQAIRQDIQATAFAARMKGNPA